MKVLVCGSRGFTSKRMIGAVLDGLNDGRPLTIIHGAARGADSIAGEWAAHRGVAVEKYPADWSAHGRRAGYIRNAQMLDEGKPDVVLAFMVPEGSKGTQMMVDLARKAGVPTFVIQGP